MRERDIQDYLFMNPEVLFPGKSIQEKAREYSIQGKRIDLLFKGFTLIQKRISLRIKLQQFMLEKLEKTSLTCIFF